MSQRTGKLKMRHKPLNPRDDLDRLHVSRKERGRGLASIEDNIDISVRRVKDYIKKNKESLITVTRIKTDNTKINRTSIIIKQN